MPKQFEAGQSQSVDDFLKAVYSLQQTMDRVSTNALAEALNVKAPSITDMARRMVEAGLVDYQKRQGVLLTNSGEEIALKILRRHRLIELYLVEELGYALHEVHEEAEHLEHAVSDRFIEAIAIKLGNPTIDPHGDPIPSEDGIIAPRDLVPLTSLSLQSPARVRRFKSGNADMLQHILDRGFKLNLPVSVTARDPFDGPLTVEIDGDTCTIGYSVAAAILVEVMPQD